MEKQDLFSAGLWIDSDDGSGSCICHLFYRERSTSDLSGGQCDRLPCLDSAGCRLPIPGEVSFGIFNFIMATLYVSFLALAMAILVGIGAAIFLSCVASERMRGILYPFVDLLAGIPSVIYGFIGLVILVKYFIRAGIPTGSCVLAAGDFAGNYAAAVSGVLLQ